MRTSLAIALTLGFAAWPALGHAAAPSASGIAAIVGAPDPVSLEGEPLDGPRLRALYAGGTAPLWTDGARIDAVLATLNDASAHGLDPAHYHAGQLAKRRPAADERAANEFDVFLSDGILRFASDVRLGRVPAVRRNSEVDITLRTYDVVAAVRTVLSAADVKGALEQLPPRHAEYQRLRALLASYRHLSDVPPVPPGNPLHLGDSSPAVGALRRRLVASGQLAETSAEGELYDDQVTDAVRAFQVLHGLAADGTLTKPTREEINRPVAQRIDQVRANLERWRWFPDDLGARHVEVNIVNFRLRLLDNGTTVAEMPVVVGKPDWRTPVVSSQIEQLVFNPPWNVPPNIIRKEMLGRMQRDPGYFGRIGMKVTRRGAAARNVVNFSLQQPPGPSNPLGRVKFHFPNVNGVYLHDTNRKGVFQAPFRAMSHGCIRVGDALGLAHAILTRDSPEWSEDKQRALSRGWSTRWVNLATPVPVHVGYATVWHDDEGRVHFGRDFYGRDRDLVEALKRKNAPVLAPPAPPKEPAPTYDGAPEADPAMPAAQPTGVPAETRVSGAPAT